MNLRITTFVLVATAVSIAARCPAADGSTENPPRPAQEPATASPRGLALPGSHLDLEGALAEAAFVALCKSGRPDAWFVEASGAGYTQRVDIVKVLHGKAPEGQSAVLSYSVAAPGRRGGQRPIAEGERVVWIVGRGKAEPIDEETDDGKLVASTPTLPAVRALPDTPENRKAIANALKAANGKLAPGNTPRAKNRHAAPATP